MNYNTSTTKLPTSLGTGRRSRRSTKSKARPFFQNCHCLVACYKAKWKCTCNNLKAAIRTWRCLLLFVKKSYQLCTYILSKRIILLLQDFSKKYYLTQHVYKVEIRTVDFEIGNPPNIKTHYYFYMLCLDAKIENTNFLQNHVFCAYFLIFWYYR